MDLFYSLSHSYLLTFNTHLFSMNDSDNFIKTNYPLITPIYIQPEWYLLCAYAILCSIPNKLGGIIVLLSSILILYTLKWIKYHIKSKRLPVGKRRKGRLKQHGKWEYGEQ